jgi:hypothetical protein
LALGSNGKNILGLREKKSWTTLLYAIIPTRNNEKYKVILYEYYCLRISQIIIITIIIITSMLIGKDRHYSISVVVYNCSVGAQIGIH